jgi:hypothetical protein
MNQKPYKHSIRAREQNMILNIQNGRRAAILHPITKSMTPDERVLKRVLVMYFEPKAPHA